MNPSKTPLEQPSTPRKLAIGDERIVYLSEAGALTAFVFVLMALHLILPGAAFLLIWVAPAVMGIYINRVPMRIALAAVGWVLIGTACLFGPSASVWALFYALNGLIAGFLYRIRFFYPLRILLAMLVLDGLTICFVLSISAVIGLNLEAFVSSLVIASKYAQLYNENAVNWTIVVIIFSSLIQAFITQSLIGRILQRLN